MSDRAEQPTAILAFRGERLDPERAKATRFHVETGRPLWVLEPNYDVTEPEAHE